MASVQTSSYGGRYLKLTVTEESTSIENNTSTVKWLLESIGGSSNYYNVYSVEVKINNTTVYGPTTKTWDSKVFPAAKGSTSGTVTIEHNLDGTANPLQFSLRGSIFNNNPQTYSDTLTLSTIPRASSITVNDANIGSATNIVINKASDSFTTTLYYKASGQSSWTKIVDKTANQVYGWTVPTSFYSLIPNSRTIQCEVKAETYNGSTLIGEKTTTATFTATGSPVINSCYLQTIDSTTINLVGDSRMIRYISTVQATVSASGQNSASISSIVVNGVTASNGIATFPNATTYSYDVTVTDSRGYSTTGNYTITWTDYISLTVNANISRNTPVDNKINLVINGNYFNGSFRKWNDTYVANTLTVEYRYKVSGASSWEQDWTSSGVTITTSGNTYTATKQLSGMTYTNSYQFEVRAIDRVNTQLVTGITVTKGEPIFNWKDDYFNVNGDYYKNGVPLSNSFLSSSGGTISGNLNVTGNLQKSGNNVALGSDIPTNNNQLINGRGFIAINVLWQNNNDTSDFTSQTITLNNNNYSYLIVIYKQDKNTNLMLSMTIPKGSGTKLISHSAPTLSSYAPLIMLRNINYTSDTQFSIEDCETKRSNQTSGHSIDNSLLIPYMILGIV